MSNKYSEGQILAVLNKHYKQADGSQILSIGDAARVPEFQDHYRALMKAQSITKATASEVKQKAQTRAFNSAVEKLITPTSEEDILVTVIQAFGVKTKRIENGSSVLLPSGQIKLVPFALEAKLGDTFKVLGCTVTENHVTGTTTYRLNETEDAFEKVDGAGVVPCITPEGVLSPPVDANGDPKLDEDEQPRPVIWDEPHHITGCRSLDCFQYGRNPTFTAAATGTYVSKRWRNGPHAGTMKVTCTLGDTDARVKVPLSASDAFTVFGISEDDENYDAIGDLLRDVGATALCNCALSTEYSVELGGKYEPKENLEDYKAILEQIKSGGHPIFSWALYDEGKGLHHAVVKDSADFVGRWPSITITDDDTGKPANVVYGVKEVAKSDGSRITKFHGCSIEPSVDRNFGFDASAFGDRHTIIWMKGGLRESQSVDLKLPTGTLDFLLEG